MGPIILWLLVLLLLLWILFEERNRLDPPDGGYYA